MAFKFVETTPEVTRGRGATSTVFTDDEVAELRDNPSMWGLVAEDTDKSQKFINWVKRQNGKDENEKPNEGPWRVRTSVHRNKSGEPHIVKGKTKEGKDKETRFVDVYVSYDPEGKAK